MASMALGGTFSLVTYAATRMPGGMSISTPKTRMLTPNSTAIMNSRRRMM